MQNDTSEALYVGVGHQQRSECIFSPPSLLNTNILMAARWHVPLSATPSILEPFTAHNRLSSNCMVKLSKQKHIANYT